MKIKNLIYLSSSLLLLSACTNNRTPLDTTEETTLSSELEELTYIDSPGLIEEEIILPDPISISIQFAGDILLHGTLGGKTADNTYDYKPFFQFINPLLDADLIIANMEMPIDANGDNSDIGTYPLFNAPFEILEAVQYAGFNHLVNANNHALDQRYTGVLKTIENFEKAHITHTGTYKSQEDFNTPTIIDVEGIQVGIIAYADSLNGMDNVVPADILPFTIRKFSSGNLDSLDTMLTDLENLKNAGADLIIFSLHWGAEYKDYPTDMQKEIAQILIENGIDIVMGHHSHTPQPVEWHTRADGSRGFIIYSLGNLMADQIALNIPQTQYGMIVKTNITKDELGDISITSANIIPTTFVRDTNRTLGGSYSIIPAPAGVVDDNITVDTFRNKAILAYEHISSLVDEAFLN